MGFGPRRIDRVGEVIREQLAEIIRRELKEPVGFLSLTRVKVSEDLRHAKVYISVLGTQEEIDSTMSVLERARGFLRRELGRRMRIRHIPELHFIADDSIKEGVRIVRMLEELKEREGWEDTQEQGEEGDNTKG